MDRRDLQRSDGTPPGLATKPDGSVDEDFYVKSQGYHPDFVKALHSCMQGAQALSIQSPWSSTAGIGVASAQPCCQQA